MATNRHRTTETRSRIRPIATLALVLSLAAGCHHRHGWHGDDHGYRNYDRHDGYGDRRHDHDDDDHDHHDWH